MIRKISEIDNKIMDFVENKCRNKKVDKLMKIITFLGDYGLIWLVVILSLLFSSYYAEAKAITLALILTIFSNELILKNLFKRKRPAHLNKYNNTIINIPKSFSFPSGHTATAFSVVPIALSKCSLTIGIVSLTSAILIAVSRVYLKVHYLTDVMVGAILGSGISFIIQNNML